MLTDQLPFSLTRCKQASGGKPPSSRFKGAWAELICHALVVTSNSGDDYPTQTYVQLGMCAPTKLNFLFCKRRPLFDALSNVYQTDVWSVRYTRDHSHCMKQNKQRRFVVLSWQDQVLRKYALKSKRFLSDFNVVAIQNSLNGFCNIYTLNVRNNSKTSRWLLLIRSVTSCKWFVAVTEKCYGIAIQL